MIGSWVFSKNVFRADDDTLPVGGCVIDELVTEDGEIEYRCVEVYRARVVYHTIEKVHAQTGMSDGQIVVRAVRGLLLGLGEDEARSKDPLKHLHAKAVLSGVLAKHTVTTKGRLPV